MPETLLLTRELVRRLLLVDAAYYRSRLEVIRGPEGGPSRIEIRQEGEVFAAFRPGMPVDSNRLIGLGAGDEGRVADLLDWYAERGVTAQVELPPGDLTPALADELHRHGYRQTGFHAVLAAPATRRLTGPDAAIEVVTRPATMEEFLDAYLAGWDMPEQWRAGARTNMRRWLGLPGWTLYLARRDGAPAAAAIGYVADGVGYLADATTHPDHRGHGLQRALLCRRFADAVTAGADVVFSQAAPLSTSCRNMIRVGMDLLYHRAHWTRDAYGGARRRGRRRDRRS